MKKIKFSELSKEEKINAMKNEENLRKALNLAKEEIEEEIRNDFRIRKVDEYIEIHLDVNNKKILLNEKISMSKLNDEILYSMMMSYGINSEETYESFKSLERMNGTEKQKLTEKIFVETLHYIEELLNEIVLSEANLTSNYKKSLSKLKVDVDM